MAEPSAPDNIPAIPFTSADERDAAEASGQYAPNTAWVRLDGGTIVQTGYVDLTGAFISTAGGTWSTLTTLDFTTMTPTDLKAAGDGITTVDGVAFTLLNTATATKMDLTANGIEFVPAAFNGLTTSKWDAPLFSFDLSTLLGVDFDALACYRAELGWNDTADPMGTPAAGSQVLQWGLWNGQPAASQKWMIVKTGSAPALDFTQVRVGDTGSVSDFPGSSSGPRFHLDFYWQNTYMRGRYVAGAFAGFVAADTDVAIGEADYPSTGVTQAISSPHTGDFYGVARQRLYCGAIRTSLSTDAFEARITDMRIQKLS